MKKQETGKYHLTTNGAPPLAPPRRERGTAPKTVGFGTVKMAGGVIRYEVYGRNMELGDNIRELLGNEVRLLDVMQVSDTMPYRSAKNEGLMEPEAEYGERRDF